MPQVDKSQRTAKVAQVEDYDSDESRVVPDSVVQARQQRQHQSSSWLSKPSERSHRRDAAPASDSGYSSYASAPLASKSPAPAPNVISTQTVVRQASTASPSKTRPVVIQRKDSARSTQRAQTVSTPAPKQSGQCTDPNCRDPTCETSRNSERRYTLPQKQPQQPLQQSQYPAASQYQQTPQYQYAQMHQMPQMQAPNMMPPPPRPRAEPMSRGARPVSIHGYSGLSYGAQPGPPPSASAYYSGYPQIYTQQPQQYLSSTPPTTIPAYPTSPVPPSPTSPTTTYPGFPGYSGSFSARQANPAVPGLEMAKAAPLPGLSRSNTFSARARPDDRPSRNIPGAFLPDPESADDSVSTSEESESSGEEYQSRKRDSRRYSRNMVSAPQSSRRPSMSKKYYTETSVPTRTRSHKEPRPQEPLRRATRSDEYVEHPSSSDINDSDRTARAVVDRRDRRSTLSSQQSSRRPSIATTSSSGRTKATSLSSATDYSRIIVEDKHGRRSGYMSKEQQDDLVWRLQQQKLQDKLEEQRLREDKVAAYQRNVGGEPYELTAENIRKQQNRKSSSHVSGRSQKSGGSGSKASRSEGIKIQSGDTVLHVYGDAKIEMRPGEDGAPAQFVIGSSNGRDSAYQGSKSSGSRMGRSRMSRRDQPIREENDYDENGYEIGR